MATIALVTANKVEIVGVPKDQWTAPAAVAVNAGQAVQLNASGKWALAKSTTAALARRVYIATRTVLAGQSLTAIRHGEMDGFDLSGLAYNAPVYLTDTDGVIGD